MRARRQQAEPELSNESEAALHEPHLARTDDGLTPTAKRDLVARDLLRAVESYVQSILAEASSADRWVSQHESPLGHRAHLRAARAGALPAVKVGRRVLVRQNHIDALLERRRIVPLTEPERDADEVAVAVLGRLGMSLKRKG